MATECRLPSELVSWIGQLSQALHARLANRLLTFFVGMLFARGRRTVASWLRGAEVGKALPSVPSSGRRAKPR